MTKPTRWSGMWSVLCVVGACALLGCGNAEVSSARPTSGGHRDTNSSRSDALTNSSSTYGKTRYPIVLVHGMAGFRSILGVVDYFYGISDELTNAGATVYVTEAAAFNSPEERGEQVLAQIEDIVARTGCGKVNLIGHSQGGLDVRYVAAVRPDLVASVTTVGTPHKGAALADFVRAHISNGGVDQVVAAALANSLGFLLGVLSGQTDTQDAVAALGSLTSSGTAAFNTTYPAGVPTSSCGQGSSQWGGISFWSWGGTSALTNILDPSDAALFISSQFYNEDNDGLVGRCSNHFGTVLRDNYSMNHLDEVNQLLGLVDIFETNPKSVYRTHANRLKNAGL